MADDLVGGSEGVSTTAAPGTPRGAPFDRLKRPAAWLAVLFAGAALLFWRLDITATWEPRYLNLALQITIVSSISLIVAVLAIRSFLHSGRWPVLWLGAGSLAYALTIALSNSLLQWENVNAAVTTHNLNVFLVAVLHLCGAFFVYNAIGPRESRRGRGAALLEVYGATAAVVILLAAGAAVGRLPPFFIQGQGGTPWRQMVVVAAALLFMLDGVAFLAYYGRSKAAFLYWYALGLLLNALVMGSTLLNPAIGSPLSWLGRVAQIAGALYLLVAILLTLQEARARQLPASEVLANFFWRDEANVRLLFESILDAIVVTDERFVITNWNRAAEQIYGWKTSEVLGKPADMLRTVYPSSLGLPQARAAFLARGSWSGEVLQQRRDGRQIPVLVSVSSLKDSSGRVVGSVSVNRDISERVRIEEELRLSEEKTRDLIRYAPTGIYEVDFRTGRFRSINDAMCEILGYSREELFQMTAFDLLDQPSKLLFGDRIRRALSGESIDPSVEYRVLRKDGSEIYGVLSVRLTYTDGKPDGAFVIAHDVTERRRAAEELRLAAETLERRVQERTADLEASREQMQLLSHRLIEAVEDERRAIARELHDEAGQLLTSLLLGLRVLERRYGGSEDAARQIAYLNEIADGLTKSMHDLAVSLRPTSLDRVGLASALRQLTEMVSSNSEIRIELATASLAERLNPEVETAVYRIVQEALTNVVRHAHATTARVTVQRQESRVIATVQDDGQGFDLEQALHRSRLGLSGMRERAEMQGGTLSIDTHPGSGTTVCADLPAGGA